VAELHALWEMAKDAVIEAVDDFTRAAREALCGADFILRRKGSRLFVQVKNWAYASPSKLAAAEAGHLLKFARIAEKDPSAEFWIRVYAERFSRNMNIEGFLKALKRYYVRNMGLREEQADEVIALLRGRVKIDTVVGRVVLPG